MNKKHLLKWINVKCKSNVKWWCHCNICILNSDWSVLHIFVIYNSLFTKVKCAKHYDNSTVPLDQDMCNTSTAIIIRNSVFSQYELFNVFSHCRTKKTMCYFASLSVSSLWTQQTLVPGRWFDKKSSSQDQQEH